MRNEKKDFTKDNIVKHLIVFGLPVLFANVLQSLYGVVDIKKYGFSIIHFQLTNYVQSQLQETEPGKDWQLSLIHI